MLRKKVLKFKKYKACIGVIRTRNITVVKAKAIKTIVEYDDTKIVEIKINYCEYREEKSMQSTQNIFQKLGELFNCLGFCAIVVCLW